MSIATLDTSVFRFSNRADDTDSVEETDVQNRDKTCHGSRVVFKSSGACVHCKSLKVKCEFAPGETVCQRCQAGNYRCLPRDRKKRKPAPTHEDLQEKAHNQDRQIQALLHQIDKVRADHRIQEWIARSQAKSPNRNQKPEIEKPRWSAAAESVEEAVISYFWPGKRVGELNTPDVVKYCRLQPDDIRSLFAIFFERIDPFFSILDSGMHTPEKLIWTCPFLFTVICAVASRYYTSRPDLYPLAMNFARDAAGRALIDGSKSVDVCQAYLLMALYPVPKKKWAEDRSWLLMGVAIRMAVELELNHPPPPTCDERESLNRTRTWLNCYCADGSHAIQFGKMPMLRLDDYLARNSRQWYKSSPMNTPFDVHLNAYVQIIILVAEWRATAAGNLNQPLPANDPGVVPLVMETQERLSRELAMWVDAYAEEYKIRPLLICAYRGNTTQMITSYLRLVVLAVGFQYSAKTGLSRNDDLVVKSIDAAREVIRIMVERLYPTGNLRFAMEAHFLYVSFAAAFLINLLRPKFLHLLNETEQKDIIHDVTQLISVLTSNNVALDGRHTPALYSRFLSSLLENTKTGTSWTNPPSDGPSTLSSSDYHQPTPAYFSWPDIGQSVPMSNSNDMIHDPYLQDNGDMDFSLSHFVRTVAQEMPVPSPEDQVISDSWSGWQFQDAVQWPTQPSLFSGAWRS